VIFCTSICSNYIPKAKVLANSLKRYNPEATFVLCLVERTIHPAASDPDYFDFVITASELRIESFESFIFKHSVVEAATAIKGHLFKELLRRFPRESEFVYLDPDILVTGPFIELSKALKNYNIVLTPHLSEPEESLEAILDNEICALKHGVFNLGFLAIKRSAEADRFIEWWAKRLEEFCYADIPNGLFTDQRWIDFAPCFFNVFILKHPGYNVAPWNLSRRHIIQNDIGEFYVGNYPLRFFHFSGFDSGANEAMVLKYCPNKENAVYKIRERYIELLEKFGQRELEKLSWSYDFYGNGKRIKNNHRLIYRSNKKIQIRFKKPFSVDASPSFYKYMKYNIVMGRLWLFCILKGRQLFRSTKAAYQTGGVKLVMEKTLKYIGRRL